MSTDTRQGLLLPFITLLFPAVASLRSITHPDFWLHVALGRTGIVRNETFSLASGGGAYVDAYWLYDLLIPRLYDIGGSSLLVLVHTLAVVIGFVFLILAARRYAAGFPIAFAVVLSTWLMLPKLDARPILLALPFMALMIYTQETKSGGAKKWMVLGFAQWFWMSLHPSFLFGPLLCILYAFSRSREDTDSPTDLKQNLAGLLAVLGVTFLNPYGPKLHVWILSHSPVMFMPISLTNLSTVSDIMGAGKFQVVLYVALAIGGCGLLLYREKLPLALITAAVATAFTSVMTMGRISYHSFAIFGFLFFVISFDSISRQVKSRSLQLSLAGRIGLPLLLLGSLFPLVSGSFFQTIGSASRLGLGINQPVVTDEAIEFMRSDPFPDVLIHLPLDGGKLISCLPERKIFIDQRTGAYPSALFNEVAQALIGGNRESWNRLDERFKPGAVLFNLSVRGSQHGVRMLLEEDEWELTYFDGISAIVLRKEGERASPSRKQENQLAGLEQIEAAKNHTLNALSNGQLPPLPLRLTGAGTLFLILDRYPQANVLLEAAHAAAPKDSDLLYQLAISRYKVQDIERSQEALLEIVSQKPDHAISWLWLARVYETQGRPGDANRAYSHGYSLNPKLADQIKHSWKLKSGV